MAQFDSLIILPLILSLLFVLTIYYNVSFKILIPKFFEVKKFRGKKLNIFSSYTFFDNNKGINLINSYKSIFI